MTITQNTGMQIYKMMETLNPLLRCFSKQIMMMVMISDKT